MSFYRLTPKARFDYFEAFDYIARDSPRAALKWETCIFKAFDHVAVWPLTGPLRPEFRPDTIRSWVVGDYIIFYDPTTIPVDIIAFLHGARDIETILRQRFAEAQSEDDSEG